MPLRLQSDVDPASLDGILATGEEKWIQLDRPLPVHLKDFTAWVKDDGTVRFHHDVQGRSGSMDRQAEAMQSARLPDSPRRPVPRGRARGVTSKPILRSAPHPLLPPLRHTSACSSKAGGAFASL